MDVGGGCMTVVYGLLGTVAANEAETAVLEILFYGLMHEVFKHDRCRRSKCETTNIEG